jgi:dolichol kinase
MITRPTKKKVASSNTNKTKVLYYIPTDILTEFKDCCLKDKESCSERLTHLMIYWIGNRIARDCKKK